MGLFNQEYSNNVGVVMKHYHKENEIFKDNVFVQAVKYKSMVFCRG